LDFDGTEFPTLSLQVSIGQSRKERTHPLCRQWGSPQSDKVDAGASSFVSYLPRHDLRSSPVSHRWPVSDKAVRLGSQQPISMLGTIGLPKN
jgi:hypothetical protein